MTNPTPKNRVSRKVTPKPLKDGESTFMNGGGELGSGSMCGGVINQTYADTHGGWGHMMAFVMPDEKFELYRIAKEQGDEREARKLFDKFGHSQI